ncbi:MAG: chemotaxis protein CheW [Clostridiales bacterium]|nr:chemotaxis protein CheW [Clostridiales bacterium]
MDDTIVSAVQDDLTGRYLTFYIEDVIYSLPLNHVIEIIGIQHITHIPSVPYYIKGVVNLRGKVVPITDVRLKFGQEERPYDDKTCIVIVVINDMNIGLIVDRVAEVVTLDKMNTAPPPMTERRMGDSYLDSISTLSEKIILNIDCVKFFQTDLAELFIQES